MAMYDPLNAVMRLLLTSGSVAYAPVIAPVFSPVYGGGAGGAVSSGFSFPISLIYMGY